MKGESNNWLRILSNLFFFVWRCHLSFSGWGDYSFWFYCSSTNSKSRGSIQFWFGEDPCFGEPGRLLHWIY